MLKRILAGAAMCALASISMAQAAMLSDINGVVMVNVGAGFQRATGAESVYAGTQIMASLQSGAKVVYSESCVISVSPGIVYTVAAAPPCSAGYRTNAGPSYACSGNTKKDGANCKDGDDPGVTGGGLLGGLATTGMAMTFAPVVITTGVSIATSSQRSGNGRPVGPASP